MSFQNELRSPHRIFSKPAQIEPIDQELSNGSLSFLSRVPRYLEIGAFRFGVYFLAIGQWADFNDFFRFM